MPFQFVISVPVFVLLLFPAAIQQKAPKPEKIKDWLQTEVQYLITEEERQVYQHLTTEEEREHFIEEFWKRRDASTERRGEFQAEFYRRAAYANENFQAGIPGW